MSDEQTTDSRKRIASDDIGSVRSKLQRLESKRCIIYPTKINISPEDTLLREIDELSVVWLDNNIHRNEDCIFTELELRRLFGNVKTFNDFNDCVTYLTTFPNKHDRVFIIVSGELGVTFLERIQELDTIVWVYVFCENKSFHTEWSKNYAKIRGVFVDRASLFSSMLPDIATYSIHLTPMRIFQSDNKQKSIHDLNNQTASFMWFQLLIRIILTMGDNRDDCAKKDLVDACRKRYEGNTSEQQRITEFEDTYVSGQAINWYTKDTFLYRSVNRAFRTADIDIIYQFRFIITEIHEQLASLPRPSADNLVVYRGQVISTAELRIIEKNQEKGFISMNTFLSTTKVYGQAVGFSGIGTGSLPEGLEFVIYQITVDQTRQPFADISNLSAIATENEILFSIGTVFRIDSVQNWPCGWLVSLTLTTEVEERFETLMKHYLDEIGQKPTLAMLGKFLMMQGDYNRAQRYFQFLLDQNGLDLDDQGRVICYTYLANIFDEKGDYDKAMSYHQQIFDIQQRRLEPNDPYFSQLYNNMAATQMALGQYLEATKNFQLALSIDLQCQPEDKNGIATSYNNIAFMYNEMQDYPKAIENYEKALEKQVELGLDTLKHPDIAITYHNLGSLYDDMQQHAKAIDYYERALVIQKASLPPEHPSRMITESSIAMAYLQMNNHTLALEKCQATLEVKLKMHPPNFPSLSKTYMNLGSIYSDMGDFTKAEAQYKIALQIRECHLPPNHPETGANHQLLGDLYNEMGRNGEALNHYQQALDIFKHQDLSNLAALGQAYTNLGHVEKDPLQAMEYLEQGIATLLSVDMVDKRLLASAYNNLGARHQQNDQLEEALTNYRIALDIWLQSVNNDENDPSLNIYYCNLGSTLAQQGDVQKGLEYTEKALSISLKIRDSYHPTLGAIYDTLGDCYDKLEKWDRAIEFYQKAVEVYKQPNAQNLRRLAETYLSIGSVYHNMDDSKKTIEYYKMALDLQLENLDSDNPDLVLTYLCLATIYQDQEDHATALTYFISMLNIQQKILSSSDLELADAYDQVGTCYFFNKQYHSAIEFYEKSLNIRKQQKSSLASTYKALGDAYKQLHESERASTIYELAIKHLIEEREKEENDNYYEELCILYKDLGITQRRLNLFEKARENLKRSLALYEEHMADNIEYDALRQTILKFLSQINEATKT